MNTNSKPCLETKANGRKYWSRLSKAPYCYWVPTEISIYNCLLKTRASEQKKKKRLSVLKPKATLPWVSLAEINSTARVCVMSRAQSKFKMTYLGRKHSEEELWWQYIICSVKQLMIVATAQGNCFNRKDPFSTFEFNTSLFSFWAIEKKIHKGTEDKDR